jgi:biopolymer transport protein ExbD
MLPLRFCLVGLALIGLAFGFLWWVSPAPNAEVYWDLYDFPKQAIVSFIFFSLFGAGVDCIFRGLKLALNKETAGRARLRIFPDLPLRNVTRWNRRAPNPPIVFAMLNAFSLSWICVLMTLLIVFQSFGPWPSKGLRIDWKIRSHIPAPESPWPETMSVYVDGHGRVLLNGKEAGWDDLEVKLKRELDRRAEWTVYVEADRDSMFMETGHVIDTIQGLGGEGCVDYAEDARGIGKENDWHKGKSRFLASQTALGMTIVLYRHRGIGSSLGFCLNRTSALGRRLCGERR